MENLIEAAAQQEECGTAGGPADQTGGERTSTSAALHVLDLDEEADSPDSTYVSLRSAAVVPVAEPFPPA
eukprot:469599-Amphidinium_carterae.1